MKPKRSPKNASALNPPFVPVNPPQQSAAPPAKEITASTPAEIGAAILAARTTAGLSQNDLAGRLKTAQTNIARLEKGGSIQSTNTLQRIAKATGHKQLIIFTASRKGPLARQNEQCRLVSAARVRPTLIFTSK